MDLLSIVQLVRRWIWLISVAGLLGGAAGLGVALVQPKMYQASTTLYIHSPNHSDYQTLLGDEEIAKAFVGFPTSGSVLAATLAALHDQSLTVSQLAAMVSATNVRQTQYVSISVRAPKPVQAANLAAEITKQSVAQFQNLDADAGAKQFALHEMETLQREIRGLEEQLARARGQTRGLSLAQTRAIAGMNTALNTNRTLYNQLVNASVGINEPQATLMQPAYVPTSPIGTGRRSGKLTAAILGLLAGVIAIIGVILLIESVYRRQEVARIAGRIA